jgi:hypothetical protein
MAEAVGSPVDLDLGQWFQLYAFALEAEPDLVLELGRGYGNSTCVFTEAAHATGGRVLSISNDTPSGWATRTEPQLRAFLPAPWFERVTIVQGEIQEHDLGGALRAAGRPFVFWDAHGRDLAEHIVGDILSVAPPRTLVAVHDVIDRRYDVDVAGRYLPFESFVERPPFASPFEELEVINAFLRRRSVVATSSQESLRLLDGERRSTLRDLLGDLCSPPTPLEAGFWIYFEI